MAKFQVYGLQELPTTPSVAGAIYYISDGTQYLGRSDGTYLKLSDFVMIEGNLPAVGIVGKFYVQKLADETRMLTFNGTNYIEIYTTKHQIKKNTFIIFTNRLTVGDIQMRAKIPYKAKINKLETVLTNVSDSELRYEIEKSSDGVTFTSLGVIEAISTGQVLKNTTLASGITVNEGDILRINMLTHNVEARGLTVNISVEEIK